MPIDVDNDADNYHDETMRLLFERSSCRSFLDGKIPEDVLSLVLMVGLHAPSAENPQLYSVIRRENVDAKQKLDDMCEEFTMKGSGPSAVLPRLAPQREISKHGSCPPHGEEFFPPFLSAFPEHLDMRPKHLNGRGFDGLGSV
jgi:nitroreductase